MAVMRIHYQAIISAPFGAVGIMMQEDKLVAIDLMPASHAIKPDLLDTHIDSNLAQMCECIHYYFQRPSQALTLPANIVGTPFQRRVWLAIQNIPAGETRTYGELAKSLGSGARAVANACGANKLPLVIPCHRVVAKNGLGGFMQGKHSDFVAIKRWLIDHEAKLH